MKPMAMLAVSPLLSATSTPEDAAAKKVWATSYAKIQPTHTIGWPIGIQQCLQLFVNRRKLRHGSLYIWRVHLLHKITVK